jgi:hypothetical protein
VRTIRIPAPEAAVALAREQLLDERHHAAVVGPVVVKRHARGDGDPGLEVAIVGGHAGVVVQARRQENAIGAVHSVLSARATIGSTTTRPRNGRSWP